MAKTVKGQKTITKNLITEEKSSKADLKFTRKKLTYVLVVLIVAGLIYFGGKLFFAASVNGRLISRLSVISELEKQGGKKTLDTIILKTLIDQEAEKRKIKVSAKDLDTEVSKIEKNIASQGATLDSLLQQQGMTKKDLIDEIKLQLLVTKMVGNNISVTDKEVDEYLASQKEQSSLGLGQSAQEPTRDQAKTAIKQQKIQTKIQTFVADLKSKAKINYFIKY